MGHVGHRVGMLPRTRPSRSRIERSADRIPIPALVHPGRCVHPTGMSSPTSHEPNCPTFDWNAIYTGELEDFEPADSDILAVSAALAPGSALDVGCGAGGLCTELAAGGWRVTGIDIAPRAIQAARRVAQRRGVTVELIAGDAASWHPPRSFDLVTSSFALPATATDQGRALAMIRACVAPGGTVVIKDFDAGMRAVAQFAGFHLPTVAEVADVFAGFEILRAEVVPTPAHQHSGGQAAAQDWTAVFFVARNPARAVTAPG